MRVEQSRSSGLLVGAIGIVYGDIGTSVLYAFKEVFRSGHVPLSTANVYGLLSLLFWTLTFIVTFKYVTLVLRADNQGEGGLVALLALASNALRGLPRTRGVLLVVGVLGAALFYGDGIITPAISVLSAIEGLQVAAPRSRPYVIPITLAALWLLFIIQKRGTAHIGRYFGPIMILWFMVIAVMGIAQIAQQPEILWALSPFYGADFAMRHPDIAFVILGALVLCVTGAEALYADMGHFGRRPIRWAWFFVVMPALVLNYFGQGALLLHNRDAAENPFYFMAPTYLLVPLVVLATLATVIASQALISGAFSVTRQLMQLGYLPRFRTLHTSVEQQGQIYIPFINWALFAAVTLAVVYFRSSDALASAYGVAVCGLMLITTTLTFFVIRYSWQFPLALCVLSTGLFLVVDVLFLSSALLKIPTGGWFPLLIAAAIFLLMASWHRGQQRLNAARKLRAADLEPLLESLFLSPPERVHGTAVFMASTPKKAPGAFLHNLKHNKVLHDENLFLTLVFHEAPWIPPQRRVEVASLGNRCFRVILHYGYKDDPNVPQDLSAINHADYEFKPELTSYFIGRDAILAGPQERAYIRWQNKIFAHMHRNASAISDYLKLPSNAVVELGALIEI